MLRDLSVGWSAAARAQLPQLRELQPDLEAAAAKCLRQGQGQLRDLARLLGPYQQLQWAPGKELLTATTAHLGRLLGSEQLAPEEVGPLSTCLHQLAASGCHAEFRSLFPLAERHLLQHVGRLEARNLSDIMWDCATTELKPTGPLQEALMHQLEDRVLEQPPANVAYVLWSAARLAVPAVEFERLVSASAPLLAAYADAGRFKPAHLVLALWALGEYDVSPGGPALSALLAAVQQAQPSINPRGAATALSTVARLGSAEQFHALSRALLPNLQRPGLSPADVARVLRSLAAGGVHPGPEPLQALTAALHAGRAGLNASLASTALWSLAKLDLDAAFQSALHSCSGVLRLPEAWGPDATAQSASNALYALASMRVEPEADLAAGLCRGFLLRADSATEQDLALVCTAVADLGIPPGLELVKGVARLVRSLGSRLGPQATTALTVSLSALVCGQLPGGDGAGQRAQLLDCLSILSDRAVALGRAGLSDIQLRQLYFAWLVMEAAGHAHAHFALDSQASCTGGHGGSDIAPEPDWEAPLQLLEEAGRLWRGKVLQEERSSEFELSVSEALHSLGGHMGSRRRQCWQPGPVFQPGGRSRTQDTSRGSDC